MAFEWSKPADLTKAKEEAAQKKQAHVEQPVATPTQPKPEKNRLQSSSSGLKGRGVDLKDVDLTH